MTALPSDADVAATLSVHSGVLATLLRMLLERQILRNEDVNAIFDAVLQPYEAHPDANDPGVLRIRLLADAMGREVVRGRAPPPSPQ
jgi:hypothetical protein